MFSIKENIYNETIINKSKFICYLIRINNENEANIEIEKIKNIYKDATHYCYGYIIDNAKRFNDDKEPSGTAGLPILSVLENNNLNNILCVVVRYFGGIKLGAGGLLRAYSTSVSNTIKLCKLVKILIGNKLYITFTYDKVKNIDNILKNIIIINKSFKDTIIYEFDILDNEIDIESLKNNTIDIKVLKNIKIEKEL